ncbi:hypothetical protein PG987_001246 [Apiospora arundinis]
MSQSDLYDFFSYVARDGKGNAESPAAVMTRRTSVMSSSSSSSSESGTPTPASTTSTTTRATATPAPLSLMPSSRTFSSSSSSSSSSSTVATPQQQHRLTADEITARILESPEHHALCELLSGRHDHDDDYARRSSDKYRAFVDLAARLEAQKMPPPPPCCCRCGRDRQVRCLWHDAAAPTAPKPARAVQEGVELAVVVKVGVRERGGREVERSTSRAGDKGPKVRVKRA